MKFNKATLVATAAAMSLGLAACDSAAENEAEENIEEMEDARDNQVDAMEEAGEITEDQADVMDESMEEQADEIDEM